MTDLIQIASEIRGQRKKRRLTQHELAERARVSRPLIAKLEGGQLPELGLGRLLRILHAVGLDLRVTTFNKKRPTFEDLLHDDEGEQ
jgi:transcriptional regulator with XRE-family HTH domain